MLYVKIPSIFSSPVDMIRFLVTAFFMDLTLHVCGEEFTVLNQKSIPDGLCVLSEGNDVKILIKNRQFDASLNGVSHAEIASIVLVIEPETKEAILTVEMKEGFKLGEKENFGLLTGGVFATMTRQGPDDLKYYVKFADSENAIKILPAILGIRK